MNELRRPALLLIVLGIVVVIGQMLRKSVGIEASADSIQAFVAGFGWKAWAAYLFLLTFRHFLLLPSTLMLTVGGLAFNIGFGGLIGTLGLMCSGVLEFCLFRYLKPDWLVRHMEARAQGFTRFVERGAPMAVVLSTAIPPTPMTAVYFAAAFTPISVAFFALCVAVGAPIRAYALSLVGAGLLADDNSYVLYGIGILTAIAIVPFVYPPWRQRLFPSD